MTEYRAPSLQIPMEDLDTLLERRAEQQKRPRATPREVLAIWMGNLGAGVGATLLVGVGLSVFNVPLWPTAATIAAAVGGVVFGAAMVWRALIDEATATLNNRRVRKLVEQVQRQADQRVAVKDAQLRAAFAEIVALEGAQRELQYQLDEANRELGQARQAALPANWTSPRDITPQDEKDARTIITHRAEHGEHLSRRAAMKDLKWTQQRHKDAMALLDAAGIVRGDSTQPTYRHANPDNSADYDLAAALSTFNTYVTKMRSKQPPILPQQPAYTDDYDA